MGAQRPRVEDGDHGGRSRHEREPRDDERQVAAVNGAWVRGEGEADSVGRAKGVGRHPCAAHTPRRVDEGHVLTDARVPHFPWAWRNWGGYGHRVLRPRVVARTHNRARSPIT